MLFASLPCGARTSWQARALGLASSLLPLFLLVSLAQAQTGCHIYDLPPSPTQTREFETFRHMAVDTDGTVYVATNALYRTDGDFVVVKVLPDGSLDPDWGTGGVLARKLTDYGGVADDVAIQPDGRIVVGGTAITKIKSKYYDNLAVVRYNPDGSLDIRNFNYVPPSKKGNQPATGGIVIGGSGNVYNLIVQEDGKIVVGGLSSNLNDTATYNLVTQRYQANGTLDTTYGTGGRAEGYFGAGYRLKHVAYVHNPNGVAFQGGGILYGASVLRGDGFSCIGLMRFQANGLLDPDFGDGGGKLVFHLDSDLTGSNTMKGFAVDTDDRIVAVAETEFLSDSTAPYWDGTVVYRFNPGGSLDTTFNDGLGYCKIDVGGLGFLGSEPCGGIVLDADGKAVTAGQIWFEGGYGAFVARIDMETGTLDTSFGGTGIVVIPTGCGATPLQVAILPDGRIVVGGLASPTSDQRRIFVARLHPDGTPDTTF